MTTLPPAPWEVAGRLQGVDVSAAQPRLPWAAIRAAGCSFAYIKACDFDFRLGVPFTDRMLLLHHGDAHAEGFALGLYGFFHSQVDWRIQAERYLYSRDGLDEEIRPIMDWEDQEAIASAPTRARDNGLRWLEFVWKRTGKRPSIYTGKGVVARFGRIDLSPLLAFDLIQAHYRWDPATGYDYRLEAPSPIVIAGTPWNPRIWQCGGNKCPRIPGVSVDLDRDVFYGFDAAFDAWCDDRTSSFPSTAPSLAPLAVDGAANDSDPQITPTTKPGTPRSLSQRLRRIDIEGEDDDDDDKGTPA